MSKNIKFTSPFESKVTFSAFISSFFLNSNLNEKSFGGWKIFKITRRRVNRLGSHCKSDPEWNLCFSLEKSERF